MFGSPDARLAVGLVVATTSSTVEEQEGAIEINDSSMDEILELQEVEPAVEIVIDAPSKANLLVAEALANQQDVNV